MLYNQENKNALQQLVGKVEWISCSEFFGDIEVVFRVDGELRGLLVRREELGGHPRERFPALHEMRISALPRKRVLACAAWLSHKETIHLLGVDEQAEWEAICEADGLKEAERRAQGQAKQMEQERREYERLREKYGQ